MANELTLNATLTFLKGNMPSSESITLPNNQKSSVAGSRIAKSIMTIPTTAGGTAIDIGAIGAGVMGMAMFRNNDTTNYIQLLTAVSGTVFAQIGPGECAFFRFPSTITAPAALANTASCQLQYLIVEN